MQHEAPVRLLCDRYGESDPDALIVRLCRELLAEQPTDAGPTPLNVLGSIRCIRDIRVAPLARSTGCSGTLTPLDGGYLVILDESEPPGRRHRSLGHEIVHTFFREVHPGPAGPEEERLCEVGAAELTMPGPRVTRFTSEWPAIDFSVINEFAVEFGVTNDAASRRLVGSSDHPICYLVASMSRTMKQERFDLGTPTLRVVSWSWSPSWPDRMPYRGLAFRADCLVAQAFDQQLLCTGRAYLGTNHRDAVFQIEAMGYSYPRRGIPARQVAVLVRK